jgi:diguanylate cyclase (GGDEF)-like protein/PAS domain S-box-containing protein
MRRDLRAIVTSLAVMAVLVVLAAAIPGLSGQVERHEALRARIESMQVAEGRFRELAISLRHGITTNYDEANHWQRSIEAGQAQLKEMVAGEAELEAPLSDYITASAALPEHWEDFKRHNSVVRNSLHYFQNDLPRLLRGLHRNNAEDVAHEVLSGLATAVFLQALSSDDRHEEIVSGLARLHPLMNERAAPMREEFRLLERHAGIILEHGPPLASDMSALVHGNARARLTRLAEANHALLLQAQTHASWYRRGLYAGVVLLLIGLALVAARYLDSLKRLGEQGNFLKSVTDTVGVGVFATDAAGNVVFANPRCEQMLGYAAGGMQGVDMRRHCLPADAAWNAVQRPACGLFNDAGASGHAQGIQRIGRLDGGELTVEYTSTSLGGGVGGTVTVIQDISQRIEEEKDLRLAGKVFSSSQQGIIITDGHGRILRANPAYCRMTGYSEDELLGENPRILKSGLQDKSFYTRMWGELIVNGRWQGELMNRRKNGERYIQWANIDAVHTEQGDMLYVGIASDISELVYTRERLANLAYYDALTGLPNRVLFHDRLGQVLAQSRRDREHFALILADLDNFKTVNDTLGHAAGDDLLVEVAMRLKEAVREADTVARIGGDEYAIILSRTQSPEDAAKVASHIIATLSKPYKIQGLEIAGGASLGVTFWPADGDSPEVLLKNADVAMYKAKAAGRNTYQFFTSDMADGVVDALRIETRLRHAIEAGELAMYFQPQIAPDGRAVAAEALMRWHSQELGWVPPSRFIPIAEHTGLIATLGDFALWQSCRQCVAWRETLAPDFRVAVNLSAAQFRNEGLVDRVAAVLHEFNLPGSALELEITESVIMEDVARGQAVISGLKRMGCKLAIDDFGTGYSSLAYLKRFSVDVLKIDKSFIDGLGTQSEDSSVAEAIVSLARSLGLEVVAEGVETAGQLEAIRRIAGTHGYLAQGYFYSPPIPAEEFEHRFPSFRQLKLVGDRA